MKFKEVYLFDKNTSEFIISIKLHSEATDKQIHEAVNNYIINTDEYFTNNVVYEVGRNK